MRPQPRVSTIVTAYNGAAFIGDAIESVLAQTRPVDEIVVIDDGSTDNTAEIAESYRARGVRCIRQENRGLPGARNRGIAETAGDLIAFLDCDDTWLREKNALQVEYLLAHPEAVLVTGQAWWWDPRTNRRWLRGVRDTSRLNIAREITVRNCIGNASGVLVRRSILEEVGGFDSKQIWAEDWELWMRILSRASVGFIDRPVIIYRIVPTGLTHQRTWSRVSGYFELSRQAISHFRPAWWRPILIARAFSNRELCRASAVLDQGLGRGRYLRHALSAFLAYPFERTMAKVMHVVRAVAGSSAYELFRNLLRAQVPRSEIGEARPGPSTDASQAG